MWQAYVKVLLAEDENRYTRYEKGMSNYSVYVKDPNGQQRVIMYYPKFRKIIEHYFDKAKREIINGNAIAFPGMGKIACKRVERDFRKKSHIRINWPKTKLQPLVPNPNEPGKMMYKKLIYITTPDWSMITWFKNRKVPNISLYEFTPANANSERTSGFKLEFTNAMDKDPLLKYRYLFDPIK
jgi:hypothetical protein